MQRDEELAVPSHVTMIVTYSRDVNLDPAESVGLANVVGVGDHDDVSTSLADSPVRAPEASPRWEGVRVTVMGLGTRAGGVGVARYLAEQGAVVTVTDLRPADELGDSLAQLDGLEVRAVLGRHDEADFTLPGAEVVVRNPGVRRDNRLLELARRSGVRVEMEMTLFLAACPAPVIGITGTKGKTSTTALLGEMLRAWRPDAVVAGNMGISALGQLHGIGPDTPVTLELSSWQLEAMDEWRLAPHIAVLTNIYPDHLDTYRDFDDYAETKRSIARHLTPDDRLVAWADHEPVRPAVESTAARYFGFGLGDRPTDGVWIHGDSLVIRDEGGCSTVALPGTRWLTGPYQRLNAAAATAAAHLSGAPVDAILAGLESFTGVENRAELVATIGGVEFVNDTAATAPAAAIASIQGHGGRRVHLIAGGADKRLPLDELGRVIAMHAATVTLLDGTATPALGDAIERHGGHIAAMVGSMAEAVERADAAASDGDVILLAPGCASFGMFRDEFDRGQRFRDAVSLLANRETPS